MWVSGDLQDFQSRLHQLPTGTEELVTGFYPEGLNYTGLVPSYQNLKWNDEFNHKWFEFTNEAMSTGTWFI